MVSISRIFQKAGMQIMRNEVARCMDEANRMAKIRAIIVTGDPAGNAFCAGADLSPAGPGNPSSMEGDAPVGRPANLQYWRDGGGVAGLAIMRSIKPVICALNGAAVGVGMTLPLACDMTVAAAGVKVGFVFGKRGLTMECLSSYMLERCVGHKVAMELVLTGRVFLTEKAPPGLFNYVVPAQDVMTKALELCAEICETSPMSAMLNRSLIIRNGYGTSPEEAHLGALARLTGSLCCRAASGRPFRFCAVESKSILWATTQADAKEGVRSFLEKRPPAFPMDPFKDSPDWFPWWREVSTLARL